jgi:HEAT repeat protein
MRGHWLLLVPLSLIAVPAHAAPDDTPPPAISQETMTKLASNDPAQIQAGLDDVRIAAKDGASAVPAIVALLRKGLTVPLTESAIATLADVESEDASETLAWYARHRSVRIRQAAIAALVRTRGPAAVAALRAALSDPDAGIRQAAVKGIGDMGAAEAMPDLFVALDHRIPGVAGAIGKLCADADCARFAAKISDLPFDVVLAGLHPMLFRDAKEVSDDTKITIISKLRDARTSQAASFLADVQKGWPHDASVRVYQALDQAVKATAGMR